MTRESVVLLAVVALVALAGCASLGVDETGGTAADLATEPPAGTVGPGVGTPATVTDVVDGDTIDVRFADGSTDTIRLLGVDSPEVRGGASPEEFEGVPDTEAGAACLGAAGDRASAFAKERLADAEVRVVVDPVADRRGGFDRLLAYVHVDGVDFNRALLTSGNARVYDSAFSRSERYYATESAAQANRTGLWACRDPANATVGGSDGPLATAEDGLALVAVHEDAPGNDNENLNDEYLVFRNEGEQPLDLGGWTVGDAAGHDYTVPDGFALGANETVTLRTGDGENTGETLYWGAGSAVWNNGDDTVVVETAGGETVLEYTYG